jgi:signal transduction histidine kinase
VIDWLIEILGGILTSLRAKVIFTIVAILLVMTGMMGYIWFDYWRNQLMELTEDQISLLFQSVELGVGMTMREVKHSDVGEILKRLTESEEMLSLRVLDTEGVIKHSSNMEEEGTKPDDSDQPVMTGFDKLELTRLKTGEGGHLRRMYPIKKTEDCVVCHKTPLGYVGVVEMELSLHHVQDIINKNRNRMIFFVIITVLVLSMTIAFLFEREVHTPISSIVDTISEVEEGNLAARINLYSEDELGLVARNLNSMLNKLESAIGELRKYHKREIRKSRQLAAVGELAASISHEIRNPLTGIKGAIQVILKDKNLSKRNTDVLNEVLAQVDRLNGTVGDLLIFSRPLNLDISPTDISYILDRTLDPLKLQPYIGETEIITDFEGLGPVPVDANLIEQAFFNIIMNSLQSIDEKGRLKVAAEDDDIGVIISFEDNGCGIPPENLEKIFRPFYTTKHRGTGLGLSIARNIVEAHNGILEVSSTEGRGTTFVITLSREPSEDEEA